jgi:uncharacterized lipoprotein YmbA
MRGGLLARGLTVFLTGLAICISGCLGRSPTPNFYALTPTQDQGIAGRSSAVQKAVIGIGPVKLADYLDESQIVTRQSDNQLAKAEFHRWVGPFKNNFVNVLADDIGSLLATDKVYLFPWRASVPIDYQVTVDVVRCDGRLGEAAWLEARWSIFQGPERKLLKTARSSMREPVTGADYAALVAAESRAVAKLSQEIAAAIQRTGKD